MRRRFRQTCPRAPCARCETRRCHRFRQGCQRARSKGFGDDELARAGRPAKSRKGTVSKTRRSRKTSLFGFQDSHAYPADLSRTGVPAWRQKAPPKGRVAVIGVLLGMLGNSPLRQCVLSPGRNPCPIKYGRICVGSPGSQTRDVTSRDRLVLLTVPFRDFAGRPTAGELVVAKICCCRSRSLQSLNL